MDICERIKMARKDLKLTQEEFGKKLGMSRSMVVNLEMGKLKNEEQVRRYCRSISTILGVSEQWLLDGSGDMYSGNPSQQLLAQITSSLMVMPDDSKKYKLITSMASMLIDMDDEQLDFIKELLTKLADSL